MKIIQNRHSGTYYGYIDDMIIWRNSYQPNGYKVLYTIKYADGTYNTIGIINEFASLANACRYAQQNDPNNSGIYSIGA